MFQRDYFMRMIEQMTEVLGQVLRLSREQKQDQALQLIDELLDERFRLSSKLIRSLSDEDLIQVMTTNGVVETDQLQAIALLMKQEAALYGEMGKEHDSFMLNVKSLRLFIQLSLMGAEPTIVEPGEQIMELLDELQPYELPAPAKHLVMKWHESEGRYDSVENVMHEMLEDRQITVEAAADIYKRLLTASDEKLEAGGLPRVEAQQGLNELFAAKKER